MDVVGHVCTVRVHSPVCPVFCDNVKLWLVGVNTAPTVLYNTTAYVTLHYYTNLGLVQALVACVHGRLHLELLGGHCIEW